MSPKILLGQWEDASITVLWDRIVIIKGNEIRKFKVTIHYAELTGNAYAELEEVK